jgi:hypothetical protein
VLLLVSGSAAICFLFGQGLQYAGILLAFFACMIPLNVYRWASMNASSNPQFTVPMSAEFTAERIVFTGPDWRSEVPWSRFNGFTEDKEYYYLHLLKIGFFAIPIPKSAFPEDSAQRFRQYANSQYS